MIEIYTDGACSPNPGKGGIGVLLIYGKHRRYIQKYLGEDCTNNIAELTAIKVALESLKKRELPLKLYTDSQYSIGVLSNPTWKPKKNKELITEIKTLIDTFSEVELIHVKGHSNSEENNFVDRLAVAAYTSKQDADDRY